MTTTKHSFPNLHMPANPEDWQQEALLTYRSVVDSNHAAGKEHQAIRQEAGKQILTMRYEAAKVAAVKDEMGKLHQQAATSMETVVKHHFSLHEAAQGKDYQKAMDDYLQYDLDTCAKHYQQAMDVGFYNIMQILGDRIRVPQEPEVITVVRPPRGLLERIFGGDE